MTAPTVITPTVDIPLSDAVQELTGFEALAVQRRFGQKIEDMGGVSLAIGVVWAYENRGEKKRAWVSIEGMSFRELMGYFSPEPDDVDESAPDSDAGKDDSSA